MENKTLTFYRLFYAMALIAVMSFFACSDDEDAPVEEEYLTFTAPSPVISETPGGMGKIEIAASGGTLPYVFYIIPEEQWHAGDKMYEMLQNNDLSRLYRYTYDRVLYGSHSYFMDVRSGTQANPRYYWVAVQDGNEDGVITGTNMLSWWRRVSVISN